MRFQRLIQILAASALPLATAGIAAEPVVRQSWTQSRVHGAPDPPRPYIAEPVFEKLAINQGLEMVALDGRLFVMERSGKVWSFVEKAAVPELDLFVDLKALHPKVNSAYGLAFHPGWRTNRQVYLAYTVGANLDDATRLSRFRFTSSESQAPRVNVESEELLFTWRSGGHNGANLQFGPDGMLYVSTGDATAPSPPDGLNTGQDNSDILSAILRIDVDASGGRLKYRVPPDNPFVGRPNVRPEIWAFGFRNPWKMSFDRRGRLWVGDVGWELWEMIHLVERGGNYGWSAMEAGNPIKPETASDLAPISPPVAAHRHTEAASMTGGYEYQGSRLPGLRGAYIYGDYETGKIWALRHDGKRVVEHTEIADTRHKIVTFGLGGDGELYYIHYANPATIHRLAPNPRAGQPTDFPRKLSQTGLFADTAGRRPNAGVYEFEIHEPMWQDGAVAERYIGLPGKGGIHTDILVRGNGSRTINTTCRMRRFWRRPFGWAGNRSRRSCSTSTELLGTATAIAGMKRRPTPNLSARRARSLASRRRDGRAVYVIGFRVAPNACAATTCGINSPRRSSRCNWPAFPHIRNNLRVMSPSPSGWPTPTTFTRISAANWSTAAGADRWKRARVRGFTPTARIAIVAMGAAALPWR